MKKLLLLTGILLCSGNASFASTGECPSCYATGLCTVARAHTTAVPQDTVKKKLQLKRVELKKADELELISPTDEGTLLNKEEIKLDKENIKVKTPPTIENKNSAEEMKSMAKRDNVNTKKKPTKPSVSYPSYPGGNFAIREFVRKNQQYPEECKRERARGRVEVIIAIAPDGTPHSATISKSSGNVYMDAEALRIAELMPKWTPAGESDDPQGTECVIFVNFRPGR